MEVELAATAANIAGIEADQAVAGTVRHDRDSFTRFYREHSPAIGRYLYRRVGDQHLVEDLLADVFLAAWRGLGGWRYRGLPIRAWLYRIASNRVNRWARRERRKVMKSLDHDLMDRPAAESDAAPTREFVRHALLILPPKFQTALALHYLEGLGIDEVAQATGQRAGTVKSHLSRGREMLRRRLEERRSP